MDDSFTVWRPGGTQENLPLPQALKAIQGIISDEAAYGDRSWEYRLPGVDLEETWNQDDNPIQGLRQVLNKVFPSWITLGLSFSRAVLICMDLGLILSVGDKDVEQDH